MHDNIIVRFIIIYYVLLFGRYIYRFIVCINDIFIIIYHIVMFYISM
jgi:hypothetical protein